MRLISRETGILLFSFYLGKPFLLTEAKKVTIYSLKPGPVFYEMSFLGKRPCSTGIFAYDNVISLEIEQEILEKLQGKRKTKFKDQYIQILINSLDEMNKNMEKVVPHYP